MINKSCFTLLLFHSCSGRPGFSACVPFLVSSALAYSFSKKKKFTQNPKDFQGIFKSGNLGALQFWYQSRVSKIIEEVWFKSLHASTIAL